MLKNYCCDCIAKEKKKLRQSWNSFNNSRHPTLRTNKCLDSVCFGQFPFFPATESPVTQEQNQASASMGLGLWKKKLDTTNTLILPSFANTSFSYRVLQDKNNNLTPRWLPSLFKSQEIVIFTKKSFFLIFMFYKILEDTARYAGLLEVTTSSSGRELQSKLFLPSGQNKSSLCCFVFIKKKF